MICNMESTSSGGSLEMLELEEVQRRHPDFDRTGGQFLLVEKVKRIGSNELGAIVVPRVCVEPDRIRLERT
jgi:hypothetical protein